jgi:hypothetical protein
LSLQEESEAIELLGYYRQSSVYDKCLGLVALSYFERSHLHEAIQVFVTMREGNERDELVKRCIFARLESGHLDIALEFVKLLNTPLSPEEIAKAMKKVV